jgi:beta-glucosidase
MKNYLPSVHHTALSQATGIRIIKEKLPNAIVGTTFSCSLVQPLSEKIKDVDAANRVDALLNRMFVEPLLGRGYPVHEIPALKKIEKYFLPGDDERLIAPFDFIGIQNYTREFVKHCWWMPIIKAKIVPANKR